MKYNPLSRYAASPFSLRAARYGKGDDALTAGRPLLGIERGRGLLGQFHATLDHLRGHGLAGFAGAARVGRSGCRNRDNSCQYREPMAYETGAT